MTLFVRDLTAIDSSYLCTQRGLVGETWLVDLQLQGKLDSMSMVWDFGQIKKKVKALIDQEIDHRLLIPKFSELVHTRTCKDNRLEVQFKHTEKSLYMRSPEEAVAFIPSHTITTETLTQHLETLITKILPSTVTGLSVTLRHENISGAYYHYTHGLKKHDGNCQRIAHGHRSMIEIYRGDKRSPDLEALWAARWQDIYLGTLEDRVEVSDLPWLNDDLRTSHEAFCYQTLQGLFELAIAKSTCEIIPADTTIELLSAYIADTLSAEVPTNVSLRIVAYEGVGKGAITEKNPKQSGIFL